MSQLSRIMKTAAIMSGAEAVVMPEGDPEFKFTVMQLIEFTLIIETLREARSNSTISALYPHEVVSTKPVNKVGRTPIQTPIGMRYGVTRIDIKQPAAKLGQMIRKKRIERGLSVTDVALICGVMVSTVSAWEHGKAVPSPAYRQQLAKTLDISLERFTEQQKRKESEAFETINKETDNA